LFLGSVSDMRGAPALQQLVHNFGPPKREFPFGFGNGCHVSAQRHKASRELALRFFY
jgi:hypothetical protein